ncbi:MAG TPA: copper resistance protein B [Steroidobacteraceae bacterium]
MSARAAVIASRSRRLVTAFGVVLAVPAMAQDHAPVRHLSSAHEMQMQDAQQAQPQTSKPTQQPAPASSPPGRESMPGMKMPGMEMQGQKTAQPKTMPPESPQHESSMPATPSMPMRTPQKTAVQHLHFGNMIGTRPKPGGLANGMPETPSMQGMDMSSMQGGSAPADARSADYSDGYRYAPMRGMDMPDNALLGMVLLDQLEYAHSTQGNAEFIDGQAWYGRNFDKLWVKAEGEVDGGRLGDLRTEALWDHAITTYWGTQLGVRRDFGRGPDRTWAAFGVQGLAPYWFDTEAALYVGEGGRTAVRLQFEYEELLTQRLILQPKVAVNLYGRNDPQRAIGAGISDTEFGLRLRYEIKRQVAPYTGIVYRQRYGHTAEFARARGEHADELQFVAGLHAWF